MSKQKLENEHSIVLYDVPRVRYGAFGGCTPYPISLKACANYLGEDIDYADAMTGCGAAFRLTWNTSFWDGGNVDICHTYQENEPLKVYIQGVTAIGRSYRALLREEDTDREQVKAFIKECLHQGVPVIAMGIVGPPEAGLVTGYRDDGDTLLGWSVFQEYDQEIAVDPCGYYITSKWWENGVDTLIAMGDKVCDCICSGTVAKRAAEVLAPRTDGLFDKGMAAYDAWLRDMRDDTYFPDPDAAVGLTTPDGQTMTGMQVLEMRQMCHYDALDCLSDGRRNAALYFCRHAAENPLFSDIADAFKQVEGCVMEAYKATGGFSRNEATMRALSVKENRLLALEAVERAKAADARAYALLQKL